MCVELAPKNLNPGFYLLDHISIYTCGVTIAPKACGGQSPIN